MNTIRFKHQNRQNRHEVRRFREPISHRERTIATRLSYGQTHKEIANDLFIAKTTVSKHLSNTMERLGLHKETELSRWITETENGLIPTVPKI